MANINDRWFMKLGWQGLILFLFTLFLMILPMQASANYYANFSLTFFAGFFLCMAIMGEH